MTEDDPKAPELDGLHAVLPRRSSNPAPADGAPSFRVPHPSDDSLDAVQDADGQAGGFKSPSQARDAFESASDLTGADALTTSVAAPPMPPPMGDRTSLRPLGRSAPPPPKPGSARSPSFGSAVMPMRIIEVGGGAKGPPPALPGLAIPASVSPATVSPARASLPALVPVVEDESPTQVVPSSEPGTAPHAGLPVQSADGVMPQQAVSASWDTAALASGAVGGAAAPSVPAAPFAEPGLDEAYDADVPDSFPPVAGPEPMDYGAAPSVAAGSSSTVSTVPEPAAPLRPPPGDVVSASAEQSVYAARELEERTQLQQPRRSESPTPLEVPAVRPEEMSGLGGKEPGGSAGQVESPAGAMSSGASAAATPAAPDPELRSVTAARRQTGAADVDIDFDGFDDEVALSLEPVLTPPTGIPVVTHLDDDEVELEPTPTSNAEVRGQDALDQRPAPPRRSPRSGQRGGDTQPLAEGERRRQWWEDFFTEEFARASLPLTAAQLETELDFIEESLGLEAGARVLDLGCGDGRYAAGLAQRGLSVVGLDYSTAMLARANERALEQPGVAFEQGDMRDLPYSDAFDGVLCWNATFGYFDEERNLAVLESIFRALKPGGSFLLDVPNRDRVALHQPSQAWFEGDGCVCMDDMHLDFITSRMVVKRTMMFDDGHNREFVYAMRLYGLHELGRLLHQVGFRVAEVTGQVATPGVFFGASSPHLIVLVTKP